MLTATSISGRRVCRRRLRRFSGLTYGDLLGDHRDRVARARRRLRAGQHSWRRYLQKGRSVYVEGRLQTRDWEDKEGQKRRTTEVVAQRVQFLGGPRGAGKERGEGSEAGPSEGSTPPPPSDEIPF